MKKLILILTATALVAFSQGPGPAPLAPGEVIRIIDVKNGNAGGIQTNLVSIFPGVSRTGNQLIVRGQPAVVDMIEEAVKKLDVAPAPPPVATLRPVPNIEITLQLIQGLNKEGAGGDIPADLEATVRQLRTAFPYKSYRVLDTEITRGRNASRTEASGMLPGEESSYTFNYTPHVNPGTAPRSVHLEKLRFDIRFKFFTDAAKTNFQLLSTGIATEIDVREGQKTVVAKSNIAGTEDTIFLIVTPKVIE
jgi:hypothetical protein